jgi:predicted O-methyltransferase YrrM
MIMNHFRILCKLILHFITARNTGGYGIHSPFLFMFNQNVIEEKHPFYIFNKIEKLRLNLLNDHSVLSITDYGTGKNRERTIADIAKHALKSAKYGQLFFRMAHYLKARTVLELGTSLGITTAYLAASSSDIKCVSLEGCPETSAVALRNFKELSLNNIQVCNGNINFTLQSVLLELQQLDLIFFDANHKSDFLLRYFDKCLPYVHSKTVAIIDDIYWSKDMEFAWNCIKNNPKVTSTIALYQLGIVFFNADLNKKHYKIRF